MSSQRDARILTYIQTHARGAIQRVALASRTHGILCDKLNTLINRDTREMYALYILLNKTNHIIPENVVVYTGPDWLSAQPNDHLTVIIGMLSDETLARIRRCCKRFRDFIVLREPGAEYKRVGDIMSKLSSYGKFDFPTYLLTKYPRATSITYVPLRAQFDTITSLTLTAQLSIVRCMVLPQLRRLKCAGIYLPYIDAPSLTHLHVMFQGEWENVKKFFKCPLESFIYQRYPTRDITWPPTLRHCLVTAGPHFAECCSTLPPDCELSVVPVSQRYIRGLFLLPARVIAMITTLYIFNDSIVLDYDMFSRLHTLRVTSVANVLSLPPSLRVLHASTNIIAPGVTELTLDCPTDSDFTSLMLTKLCIHDATQCGFPLLPRCLKQFIYAGGVTIHEFRTLLCTDVTHVHIGANHVARTDAWSITQHEETRTSEHINRCHQINRRLINDIDIRELTRSKLEVLKITAYSTYTWRRLG